MNCKKCEQLQSALNLVIAARDALVATCEQLQSELNLVITARDNMTEEELSNFVAAMKFCGDKSNHLIRTTDIRKQVKE